ncbi:MAG: hypothetical protein COA45_03185 [Zetaproteobacteria bacterium]|nr:MAG: hypothetical protein COA45_03185 [Zetaproteobacteria bacterium]
MSDKEFEISSSNQEWSHSINSDDVGVKPFRVNIVPEQEIFPALCRRLGIHSIESLKVDIKLQRNSVNKVIHVYGHICADIHQKCVITAEPVQESIDDKFESWFEEPNQTVSFEKARRERMSRKEQEKQPVINEEEDPEKIIDGKIDLGDLIIQNLSLALNAYPRIDGAVYDGDGDTNSAAPEGTYDNPFAALKDWKQSEAKKDK